MNHSLAGRALAASAVLATLLAVLPSAPARAEGDTPAHKVVNVNQASATELARLPRVGPALAQRIVDHRTQHGPFKRSEDLMEVKGIGEKVFATLKPYLATSGPTTLTEKVSSARGGGKGTSRSASRAPQKPAAGEGR